IYAFFTSKGYAMSRETFARALAKVEVDPGFPSDLVPGLQKDAEVLLREKKISAIPDWNKALRPDLWAKAKGYKGYLFRRKRRSHRGPTVTRSPRRTRRQCWSLRLIPSGAPARPGGRASKCG